MTSAPQGDSPRVGRQRSTSIEKLSHIGLSLFAERGFEQTTVDDIATAAQIGRRTFFRYFPSKNDLPWGEFDVLLEQMREHLEQLPRTVPILTALRDAVVAFNTFPASELPHHRRRMQLLLSVPALTAHSTLRYTAWRQVIADFAADRIGVPADSLMPQVLGRVILGLSLAAYEQWLRDEDADLIELFDHAFALISYVQLEGEERG